jgi:hypothetical protein
MFQAVPDATALADLHEQAKREACRLRSEAIGEFWRGADAVWQRSLVSGAALAQRSAARLQTRLARRKHLSTPSSTTKA